MMNTNLSILYPRTEDFFYIFKIKLKGPEYGDIITGNNPKY